MKKILGSFVSVVVGWAAGVVWFSAWSAIEFISSPYAYASFKEALGWLGIIAAFMWLFLIPSWLLVLLPFYLLVPRNSRWWNWPICTFLGAVAGGLIMLGYIIYRQIDVLTVPLISFPNGVFGVIPAALIGGVSFLTASLTSKKFAPTPKT